MRITAESTGKYVIIAGAPLAIWHARDDAGRNFYLYGCELVAGDQPSPFSDQPTQLATGCWHCAGCLEPLTDGGPCRSAGCDEDNRVFLVGAR
jgi:hypothetical protein